MKRGTTTSVALPWKAEDRWREEDFNNALAWLLQVEPLAAVALAARAGIDMSVAAAVKVRVRTGTVGDRPDLIVDGSNARGRRARVVVELKTNLQTGLTPAQKGGYSDQFEGIAQARGAFLLVAPKGYARAHTLPNTGHFITHDELREVLEATLEGSIAHALVDDMWSHFFGLKIDLRQLALEPGRRREGNTRGFLRRLVEDVNDRESLSAVRVDGTRARAEPEDHWYGVNISRKGKHTAWMGFYYEEGGASAFCVNSVRKRPLKAMRAAELGEVEWYDNSSNYRGGWSPRHLGETFSPEDLLNGGLGLMLDAIDRKQSSGG